MSHWSMRLKLIVIFAGIKGVIVLANIAKKYLVNALIALNAMMRVVLSVQRAEGAGNSPVSAVRNATERFVYAARFAKNSPASAPAPIAGVIPAVALVRGVLNCRVYVIQGLPRCFNPETRFLSYSEFM